MNPHTQRPPHDPNHPCHITVRRVAKGPNLRTAAIYHVLVSVIARASAKGFRLIAYSVQANHVHLLVEADDGEALFRGMQRLLSRTALMVNLLLGRTGSLWRDRYHRRDLCSPREFRNALVYVLFNSRKHVNGNERDELLFSLDPYSSAAWHDAWDDDARPPAQVLAAAGPRIVAAPKTWFARAGWKRHGLLRIDELPRFAG